MQRQPTVITGVGIVSAIGIGRHAFFDSLLQSKSGIRSLQDRTDGDIEPQDGEEPDGLWIGAPIVDFEPKQHVKPRKALKVMCREIQTAFAAAHLACRDASYEEHIPATDSGGVRPERLGVVYGSEIFFNPPAELVESIRACLDEAGELHPGRFGEAARREVMPLWMLKYLPNMPACQVGISLNSQGPNNSLVLGDVSGPAAVLEAESYLQRGIADVMVVGATGTRLAATRLLYRTDMPTAERNGFQVEDASRPHDPHSHGVVGGEGAAAIVMETKENANGRDAVVLAEVIATASRFVASDAMGNSPRSSQLEAVSKRGSAKAISLAIQSVLNDAGIAAADVGAVVSHAIGERQMDAAEAQALRSCSVNAPVVAISWAIGHAGAASGMMEIATGALICSGKTVPPTRGASRGHSVPLLSEPSPLATPFVLCLSHTSDGSAMAVLLKASEQ